MELAVEDPAKHWEEQRLRFLHLVKQYQVETNHYIPRAQNPI